MIKKNVLKLRCDDWEAIYVDGKAVNQGHDTQSMELLELAQKHNFSFDNVRDHWATPEDEEAAMVDAVILDSGIEVVAYKL